VTSALTGVAQGINGVIEKPIEGAKSEGIKGLMTGILKGFGGLVIMPVSGAMDLVSKTSEGFKNMIASDER
jgi:vacuolar protein sorting-associated protein 13A/C